MKAVDCSTAFSVSLQAETTSLFNFVNRITSFMKYCAQSHFNPGGNPLHYKKQLYRTLPKIIPVLFKEFSDCP